MAVALGVDQASKAIARASLEPGEKVNVFFGIDLTNVENEGVAFGFLSEGGPLVWTLTLLALTALVGYFARRADVPWLWLPAGAVLGGALSNLLDRAREGAVFDFIDPSFWPAFNLADAQIVLGVLGLLYVVERFGKGEAAA
jgi:signal peptidase II